MPKRHSTPSVSVDNSEYRALVDLTAKQNPDLPYPIVEFLVQAQQDIEDGKAIPFNYE